MTWPTFGAQIGFADPTASLLILDDPERGLLNEGLLAPDPPAGLQDVSTYLYGDTDRDMWQITRGRTDPRQDFPTGKATVIFRNDDGQLDPLNPLSTFVIDGVNQVMPGLRLWLYAIYNGVTYSRFYGFIDAWTPDVTLKGWPVIVVQASGALNLIANFQPDASVAVGAGEDTGARISRIFANANVLPADLELDVGNSTLQATTLSQNALDEAHAAVLSEIGAMFELATGEINFARRLAVTDDPLSRDVQATFGPPYTSALPYQALVPAFDKLLVINDISASATGLDTETGQDTTSIAQFFHQRLQESSLVLQTDAAVAQWVAWILELYGNATYRYSSVTIDPLACPDDQQDEMWEAVLGTELRNRYSVTEAIDYTTDGVHFTTRANTAEVLCEQITEKVRNTRTYSLTLALSDATPYTGLLILDDPERGLLNDGLLGPF